MLHPVSDLAAAKPVYTALLGAPPQHDAEYYVGYDVEAASTSGWCPAAEQGRSPVAYWECRRHRGEAGRGDRRGRHRRSEAAHEVGGGRLVATFTDPDGNVIGLVQDR